MSRFFIEGRTAEGKYFPLQVLDVREQDQEVLYVDGSGEARVLPTEKAFAFWKRQEQRQVTADDEVEVYSKSDGCWWPAKVHSVKGDFATVVLRHSGQQEVAETALTRPAGQSAPLGSLQLHRYDLQLPEDLDGDVKDEEVQHDLLRRLAGPLLPLTPPGRVTLLSLNRSDVLRLGLIRDLFLRSLRWKLGMRRAIGDLQRRLAQLETVGGHVMQEFSVPRGFVGCAMGAKGANIKRAKALPGVSAIEFDDNEAVFRIYGVDADSCLRARMLLEFMEDTYMVPDSLVGRIIGRGGRDIQTIVEKSEVLRVHVGDSGAGEPIGDGGERCTPFTFSGTRSAIENARFMMDFEVETQMRLDELARKQAEMAAQLRASAGTARHWAPAPIAVPESAEAESAPHRNSERYRRGHRGR